MLRFPFRFLLKFSSARPAPTTVRVLCWDICFFSPLGGNVTCVQFIFFVRAARGNTHIFLHFSLFFGIFARHRVSPAAHPNNPDDQIIPAKHPNRKIILGLPVCSVKHSCIVVVKPSFLKIWAFVCILVLMWQNILVLSCPGKVFLSSPGKVAP